MKASPVLETTVMSKKRLSRQTDRMHFSDNSIRSRADLKSEGTTKASPVLETTVMSKKRLSRQTDVIRFFDNWAWSPSDWRREEMIEASRRLQPAVILTKPLRRQLDSIHSRALRAHHLLAWERLELSAKAIRPTRLSLDAVLGVLGRSFPRILKLRPRIAAALPAFDLALLDKLPLYVLDFFYCGAMADLARVLGRASPLQADKWNSERDRAVTLLMRAYDEVRGAVAFVPGEQGDAHRIAPPLSAMDPCFTPTATAA